MKKVFFISADNADRYGRPYFSRAGNSLATGGDVLMDATAKLNGIEDSFINIPSNLLLLREINYLFSLFYSNYLLKE